MNIDIVEKTLKVLDEQDYEVVVQRPSKNLKIHPLSKWDYIIYIKVVE